MGLHSKILVSGLLITVASLPFSPFGTSVGIVLVALSFIAALITGKADFSKGKLFTSMMALFAWCIIGLAWTENFTEGLATINIKLPLLILPLALFTVKWDSKKWLRHIATVFIASTFLAAIAGLINGYYLPSDLKGIKIWSPFISHIRMSLMLSLGLGILLLEKRLILAAIYGLITAVSIWHTQSVTGVLLLAFVIYFALITTLFPLKRELAFSITCVGGIAIIFISFLFLKPKPFEGQLPDLTPWGNSYVHNPEKCLEENGHKVWNFLCESEVQKEWNKRSSLKYYSVNEMGSSVRDRVVRYMSSLGVPKNGAEVTKLSDDDIANIENGHTSIRMSTHSGLALRMDDLKFELGNYIDGGDPNGSSVTMRFEAYKTGVHIITTSGIRVFLGGVGTGDLPDAFSKAYIETESRLRPEFWKRTHNQYLAWWIALGLIGIMLWTMVLLYSFPFISNHARLSWWIVAISCLAEDTLETQAGVTFAALILTLFVSSKKWKS